MISSGRARHRSRQSSATRPISRRGCKTLAEADSVVIAASTRRLLGDVFRSQRFGRQAVKGYRSRSEAWAALGVSRSESRFELCAWGAADELVGREAERQVLERQRRAWAGQGQIVLISGEAGIGKSRLSAWLAEQSPTRRTQGCDTNARPITAKARSILSPAIRARRGYCAPGAAGSQARQIGEVLGLATDRMNEVAPLIASMLSIPLGSRYPTQELSPPQQRWQTLSALLDQMEGLAKQKPVLILFEDAHWADATSLELLDPWSSACERLPILFLITFRPEFVRPWKGLPDVETLALRRLDRAEAETLVERVAGGRKLPADVLEQIIAKTDGVPFSSRN